jgi:hypothetical protein
MPIVGQNTETIFVDARNARPLNLSEIAEKVIPIPLGGGEVAIQNQNVLLTSEYLFVASIRHIIQYDSSGNVIRLINCEGYITDNITSDMDEKKLYVPVGNKIKCYDYLGQLVKEYSLESTSTHCLYHNGVLWVQSYNSLPDGGMLHTINKINLATGEITALPYQKKIDPVKYGDGWITSASFCRLTLYNNEVVVSFEHDNEVYKIWQEKIVPLGKDIEHLYKFQQDKVTSLVKWDITPSPQLNDMYTMAGNGFVSDYLFINYRRDNQFYLYLESMKTGKKYNVSQINDDIFHTSGHCNIHSMAQNGCFVFIKENNEIKGDSIENIPLKSGPIVFIVKPK